MDGALLWYQCKTPSQWRQGSLLEIRWIFGRQPVLHTSSFTPRLQMWTKLFFCCWFLHIPIWQPSVFPPKLQYICILPSGHLGLSSNYQNGSESSTNTLNIIFSPELNDPSVSVSRIYNYRAGQQMEYGSFKYGSSLAFSRPSENRIKMGNKQQHVCMFNDCDEFAFPGGSVFGGLLTLWYKHNLDCLLYRFCLKFAWEKKVGDRYRTWFLHFKTPENRVLPTYSWVPHKNKM